VRTGLMPAAHDLRGHLWVPAHRVADHERGHRDVVGVEQMQDAGYALAGPVLIKLFCPRSGKPGRIDSVIGLPAPLTGWPPASNCIDTVIASRAPLGQTPPVPSSLFSFPFGYTRRWLTSPAPAPAPTSEGTHANADHR
jgi:hypothetical protein